jgi:hypothetical protein
MEAAMRRLVRHRAGDRCEYCLLHQEHSGLRHHLEHIVARQHGGSDNVDNLALACHRCNMYKGPNLSGIDPRDGRIASLFHPAEIDGASTSLSMALGSPASPQWGVPPFILKNE